MSASLGRAALFAVLVLPFPALVCLAPPAPQPPPSAEPKQVDATPRTDRHGDPLPPGAVARLGTVRFRHGARIQCVAVSPDGKVLASGGRDHHFCLWETATGKRLHRLADEPQHVHALAFSGDGRTLAALTVLVPGNHKVMLISLWEVASGKMIRHLQVVSNTAEAIAFTPDGEDLLFAAHDGNAAVIRKTTGELVRRLEGHRGKVLAVAFAPDGRTLTTASADKTVRRWDTATGRQLGEVAPRDAELLEDRLPSLAFSPDGRRLVLGNYYRLHLYDAATGKQLWESKEDRGVSCSPVFSPDGRTVAGGCMNDAICLWDAASGKEIRPRSGHQLHITALAFSPDGRTVASFGEDTSLYVWDVLSGKERIHYPNLSRTNRCLVFTPDGTMTAWTGWRWERDVRLWDALTGKERRRFAAPREREVQRLAFAPNGAMVATATDDGLIRLWDGATGKELRQLTGGPRPVHLLTFSADGKRLASGDSESLLRWWDVGTGKELSRLPESRFRALTAALSPDGRLLAWSGGHPGGGASGVRLMHADTGEELDGLTVLDLWEIDVHRHAQGHILAFSPDGKALATCNPHSYTKPTIRIHELATRALRCRIEGHLQQARALAFSGDSKLLVSGGWDCTALVWDLTGRAGATPRQLPPERLEALWADLAGRDAETAYRAMQALAAAPFQSVPLLRARLRPVEAADPERTAHLLRALNEKRFEARRQAEEELAKLRDGAEPALRDFLTGDPPLEARRRVEGLLGRLESEWREPAPERLRFLRAAEVLEWLAGDGGREVLVALAGGATGARATEEARAALQRLARATALKRTKGR